MKLKKLYLFLTLLTAFLWLGTGTMRGDELTVGSEGSTNDYVPITSTYADVAGTRVQTIYPASLLTEIAGKDITGLSFPTQNETVAWGSPTFAVRLGEVDETAFASNAFLSPTFTTVYSGALSVASNALDIVFSENFNYSGDKSLLVDIEILTSTGDWGYAKFYGNYASNAAFGNKVSYGGNGRASFRPMVTITYGESGGSTCAKPGSLAAAATSSTSATITWKKKGSESAWDLQYSTDNFATNTELNLTTSEVTVDEDDCSYTLTGLTAATSYKVQLRANCGGGEDVSGYTTPVSFRTYCSVPFADNFESQTANATPAYWDNSASTSTTASQADKPAIWNVYQNSGNKMIRMYNYWAQSGVALINTPIIELPAAPAACELTFDYAHTASCGVFYVKVSTNNGVSFTNLNSYDKTTSGTDKDIPGSFTEATIDLTDYAGERIILQFYANANYGSGSIFVDNISVHAVSACSKPTGLSYDNVTDGSVDLSWTAGASETAWKVRYMADDDADWTVIPADDNDGFTVSGLSDNTHYTMQVQADCGSEVVSEWNSTAIDFTTKCNPFAMPFTQTFNDLTAGIPDCWDNSEGTTDNDAYKWNYYATGYSGKCVRFEALYNATNNDNYLKTPSITVSEAAQLSFRYKNPKGAALSVYYSIDGGSKVAWLTSLETKTTWSDLVVEDLPAACEGHSVVIMFKGVSNCSYGDAYIYLDEVQVKAVPTCITPTGLGYSAVTAEGATLSWTAGASETAWKVQYSEDNSSWSEAVDATSNPFVLTGLDDNTLYYVRVAANCGESVSDYTSATVSFTTKCAAITSFPWSEDFQGETNETNIVCWDNSASTCFTNPAGSTPSKYVWGVIRTGSYGDYNYQLYMRNFNVRAGTALINTPSFTLPSDKDMQLVFNYSHLASCDPLVVKISQNGGAFAAIDGASYSNNPAGSYSYSSPGTYKEATIDLSAYRGKTITLQFFTTANFGEGAIWLDNVKIEQAPTCFKPQNLSAASSITPDGATFTWEASGHGETTYQWAVAAGSDTPAWVDDAAHKTSELTKTVTGLATGSYKFYVRSYCSELEQSDAAVSAAFTTATVTAPTIGTITTTNETAHATWTAPDVTYSVQYQWSIDGSSWSAATSNLYADISDLEDNTSYTFYVRSYYDASHQSANATKAFKTACDPFTVAVGTPFEQNFNDVTTNAIPDCWNNSEGTTTTASYKWKVVTGGQSGKCAMFNGTDNGLGKTNVLATPLIELNSDADLSFYWKNKKTGAYTVDISVDGAARTPLISSGLTGKDAWTLKEQPLSAYNGHTIQLFFCGTSANDGSANLYLDEFKITPVSCRKPASRPVASAITANGATLNWGASPAAAYQYSLVEAGEDPVWEDVATNSKEFTNLQPTTNYNFAVRSKCGEESFSDTLMVSFRTDCGVFALPFEENFDGLADVTTPECWNNTEGTLTDNYKKWRTYNNNYLRFNSSTTDAGETSILATPTIQLGEGNLLTFKAKNPTGGDFKVQIESEGIAREDLITDITGLADWTPKYAVIPAKFNNKKVQIFFCATSNEGDQYAYIEIDDIRVARGELFSDAENNQARFATLAAAPEAIDVIFNRTLLGNGDYNTFCLPFSLDADQLAASPIANFKLKAYDYATIENEELLIAITNASSIEAGVPYFIANNANEANLTEQYFKNVVISADAPGNVENSDVTFQGVFNPVDLAAQGQSDAHNQLFLAAGNTIYWPAQNKTVKGFRAYFQVNVGGLSPIRRGMPARIVERQQTPTGCENVNGDVQTVKVIENNHVIIIRNGVKYSIQGQVISK